MSEEEVSCLPDQYASAAKIAKMAGFTGVQIHAGHGFLLSQFLSPLFNRRADKYGGSVEARSKIVVEIISRLVKAPKWIKLWTQAIVSIGFGVYYWFILPAPQNFPLTAMVMFALAIALIYQGRRAKISPDKSPY